MKFQKKALKVIGATLTLGLLSGCATEYEDVEATLFVINDEEVPLANLQPIEAPMISAMILAEELPIYQERVPGPREVYVEEIRVEDASYTQSLTQMEQEDLSYYNDFTKEPLFEALPGEEVLANVAKDYEVSEDGKTYTIYLRLGMKWSDGSDFTAEDVAYFYNYMLISDVDEENEYAITSFYDKEFDWYKTTDPLDGIEKPAVVKVVDETTFTIELYEAKPSLLYDMALEMDVFFAPKSWYKDIVAVDPDEMHWSKETDLEKLGGNGLDVITQQEAVVNALVKDPTFQFTTYEEVKGQLGDQYWLQPGRPTLRAWIMTSQLQDETKVMDRNLYYWKVDLIGRQLPFENQLIFLPIE